MSATAFQRARREAAATMRVAAEADAIKGKEDQAKEHQAEEHQEHDLQESEKSAEYTVAQLKEMCEEKGIEYKARATKAELIELLGL